MFATLSGVHSYQLDGDPKCKLGNLPLHDIILSINLLEIYILRVAQKLKLYSSENNKRCRLNIVQNIADCRTGMC